ncbi:MAG: HAMP domain-containing histidine kinase [Clostridium sp.]|jgi:signal transduction histidine kinase|nr:HAMP domain-containing histidine kinase [Clostridium sp.]
MRHSIRTQYAGIFIALMAGTVFIEWFINHTFLERFYVSHKRNVLQVAYERIDTAFNDAPLFQEASYLSADQINQLDDFCYKHNILALVMDFDSKYAYASENGGLTLLPIWERNVFGFSFPLGFFPGSEPSTNENLEFFGDLNVGYTIVLQTPLESIRESAQIANMFLAFVGFGMVMISGLLTWLISKRITQPILELTKISQKMIHLDFEAKYEGHAHNETALLGENINRLSETLEKTISDLKTANNELKTDIAQKEQIDEMRKEFLSNISHELKTPIALIQGYAEGLREDIHEDAQNRDFYCEVIMDEAAKMNQMVRKLMTLNQLEFGQDVVAMERFDVVELIQSYLTNAAILVKQNDITVKMTDLEPIYVWGDEFKIEEVFMNYFTNALHHAAHDKIIELSVTVVGNKVRVGVFNTGEPIPEQSLPKLWDKFYKVDQARTREYGGSGIGLSIVKAIMESMNQEYGVANFTNGVQFWFTLEYAGEVKE